mgnify:CR=1 FL=1
MPPEEFANQPTDFPEGNPWIAWTYLQYIGGLEGQLREESLRWVQVCRFAREQPVGCELFVERFASLGIDRLGLPNAQVLELLEAVAGVGVRVPRTAWKLRVARPWCALFEPMGGDEPLLPTHWLEGLELHGKPDSVWIGRSVLEQPLCPAPLGNLDEAALVASKRTEVIDCSVYQPHRFGWRRRDIPSWPTFMEANS